MKHKLLAILATLLTTACGAYHEVKAQASDRLGGLGDGTLSYQSVNALVFQPFCLNCHSPAGGNRGGINLETFAAVKALAGPIRASVESGFMPLRATLPDREKQVLFAWLDAGAPEVSSLPLPGAEEPVTPVSEPDFAAVSTQIFEPFCLRCHQEFATYTGVKPVVQNILDQVLSDQMPRRGPPLAPELKELLSRWVANGAPEFTNERGQQ